MAKVKHLKIVNLDKFQHYTDRHMIWFKWHIDCLQNYDFISENDSTKWVFIGLVCLACRTKNSIVYDVKWLEKVLNTSNIQHSIDTLISKNMIASCYQPAIEIREDKIREEKKRREIREEARFSLSQSEKETK